MSSSPTVGLRRIAQLNPPVDEFNSLPDEAEVTFAPLEVVWSDSRLDLSRTKPLGQVRNGYTRFRSGDVLVPKVTPTHQAGRSALAVDLPSGIGAGTTELHILRARPGLADPRWLKYAVLSKRYLEEGQAAFQGVAGLQRVPSDFVQEFRVADLPLDVQRRVADFLDDQVTRLDNIIAARREQAGLIDQMQMRLFLEVLTGSRVHGPRKPSGIPWLGSIPSDWQVSSVHSAYEVVLGKMLDEAKATGRHPTPYLRNTNVQWGRIDLSDVKQMDIEKGERPRFTVKAGDLLICEGGQPGRCAIWDGRVEVMGFQKALHRARSRGAASVEWLAAYLRVATSFDSLNEDSGQTTISHLTGEQLRSRKIPLPPKPAEARLLADLASEQDKLSQHQGDLSAETADLQELKRSLISAAVSGEFDVTSADGSGVRV